MKTKRTLDSDEISPEPRTRYEILSAIRFPSRYLPLADNLDTRLLLSAGVMPLDLLHQIAPKVKPPILNAWLDYLERKKKIARSPTYVRANPRDRTRPIASQYNIDRPHIPRTWRGNCTYRVFGKDRHALWEAASNLDMSGSRGEGHGLYLILRFWRLKHVQRSWKKFIERPRFRLTEWSK